MTRPAERDPMDEIREQGIRDMLKGIGENPDREGLVNTPMRVVRAWREICSGYKADPSKLVTVFDSESYDEMISVGPVAFYSTCEHHLLPFFGDAWVAYVPAAPVEEKGRIEPGSKLPYHSFDSAKTCCLFDPDAPVHGERHVEKRHGKIIGLSKLPRIVEMFARRLQNQERLTQQITGALTDLLAPRGAACFIRARHFCMMARGVKQHKAQMSTVSLTGVFKQGETRAEFFELTKER